jgi:hypothetical protein
MNIKGVKNMKEIRIKRDIKYPLLVIVYSIILTALIILVINLFKILNIKYYNPNDIIYTYNTSNNSYYNIYLKSNEFIDQPILGMNKMYITELIDYIDIYFVYDYSATKKTNLNYLYNINANIIGLYSNILDNTKPMEVWNKEYILKDITNINESMDTFKISENLKLKLDDYNKEVDKFKQVLGIPITTFLRVTLNIEINGRVNNKNFNDKYINTLDIPLGIKAFEISKDLDSNKRINIYAYGNDTEINIENLIIISGLILIVFLIGILFTRKFVLTGKESRWEKSINKILKEYDDKVIIVDNLIHLPNMNYIAIKQFDELIELSDELNAPILFWYNEHKEEAWFSIINKNIMYRHIMKKIGRQK